MNLLNLLTKEKNVAGIEISDSVVRIAFFKPNGKKYGKQLTIDTATRTTGKTQEQDELILIEEPIASNIIANGVVADVDLLGKTLKTILLKAKLGTSYAIVAIPDDAVYSRIFSFPKTVDGARITEAMRLAINFQLPIQTDNAYLDWERTTGTSSSNEILLSTVSQEVVRGYIKALDYAGIKTLALESHLASIARAVKLERGHTTLFSKKTPDGATIFALKDGILRFSRTLPLQFVPEHKIPQEMSRLKNALEAETEEHITEKDIQDAEICDEYRDHPALTAPKSKWLVALGAVIRGNIPDGNDNLVSLLPVGTEDAYAYQKTNTFATLIRNITVGVSIFFIISFLSTYLFMVSLSQNTNQTATMLSSAPVPPLLIENEMRIGNINALTEAGATILRETPDWSTVLYEINSQMIDGITVSNFSASGVSDKMSLSGTAKNRAILNQFKKSLQNSPMLVEVEIPTTNLEQKELLPFSASFRFSDPSVLYYK